MTDVKTANVLFLDGRYKDAIAMYLNGAKEGDAECAHNYAYCLLNGIGTERDAERAKSFFVFASSSVGEALYNLAVMHLHGVGVKRDYRKAVEYMSDAAEAGIIEAQLYLGIAHTLGSLFEPDIVAISTIPYHTPIYREEGMLLDGDVPVDYEADEDARIRAVHQDLSSAFYWFGRAARHSSDYCEELSKKSKFLYARCFLDGVGTDFNRDKANSLMLIAAKEGSEEAMYYLETEAPYMLENLKNEDLIANLKRMERLG